MKKQILYILIAAIIAFTSSLLTVIYMHYNSDAKPKGKADMIQTMKMIYNELELNENQIQAFNKITGEFHKSNKSISNEIKQNLGNYYNELSKSQPDSSLLVNFAQINGQLNRDLMQNSSWYFTQTAYILDSLQIEKLKNVYKYANRQHSEKQKK